jgi:hypothetical protein
MVLGRPRRGIPRARPPSQTMIHILESDYNKLIMSRQYPRETIYDILHRKLDALQRAEKDNRDMQLIIDTYKEFIVMKELEEEFYSFCNDKEPTDDNKSPQIDPVQEMGKAIPNKYPDWDI